MTSDFPSQFAAARAGLGVALLPCIMGDACPDIMRVAPEQPEKRPVWLVIHADLHNAPAVRAVSDFLINVFGKGC
ncbi:LysR substrate-binding domain-containing protein [Croceicoccus sp. YJ47]|uniref:LysR substrate-binding domain-containing protein n=1 Tax=Croceicoccus sp. YJ47 TaxID=2798724 RepID=UPI001921F287|nr:LysR substrate-binding domain-containing protein [Croceicoccus sp. YJ47]QQN74350.1 LysR family transcriptional regulator [Croceicoccus sp. YJ47]